MKVYIVNGAPGSGKTTLENYVIQQLPNVAFQYSTVTKVKEIATQLGWDGSKTPHNRKFLSDLKDLLTEWEDIPYLDCVEFIYKTIEKQGTSDLIFFIDCREPQEIRKFKRRLDATTILVHRVEAANQPTSNDADKNVYQYSYDYIIDNNKTLDDFYKEIDNIIIKEGVKNYGYETHTTND